MGYNLDVFVGSNLTPGTGPHRTVMSAGISHGGYATTGILSLMQRVIITLLTNYNQHGNWGTGLVSILNKGSLLSAANAIQMTFSVAAEKALGDLQEDADELGLPNDEYPSAIVLTSWEIDYDNGRLDLQVSLTSKAGESRVFTLPIRNFTA